jgi:hypothetical protein
VSSALEVSTRWGGQGRHRLSGTFVRGAGGRSRPIRGQDDRKLQGPARAQGELARPRLDHHRNDARVDRGAPAGRGGEDRRRPSAPGHHAREKGQGQGFPGRRGKGGPVAMRRAGRRPRRVRPFELRPVDEGVGVRPFVVRVRLPRPTRFPPSRPRSHLPRGLATGRLMRPSPTSHYVPKSHSVRRRGNDSAVPPSRVLVAASPGRTLPRGDSLRLPGTPRRARRRS